jgi:hypothetical protein
VRGSSAQGHGPHGAIHQERTIDSVIYLKSKVPEVHITPVLQGQRASDFLRHADQYEARGIDLAAEAIVCVGSVFNRQEDDSIIRMLRKLHHRGIKTHALGFKRPGLIRAGAYIASADSMSWSFEARRRYKTESCGDPGAKHKHCGNCYAFARRWLLRLHQEVPLDESLDLAVGRHGLGGAGPGDG